MVSIYQTVRLWLYDTVTNLGFEWHNMQDFIFPSSFCFVLQTEELFWPFKHMSGSCSQFESFSNPERNGKVELWEIHWNALSTLTRLEDWSWGEKVVISYKNSNLDTDVCVKTFQVIWNLKSCGWYWLGYNFNNNWYYCKWMKDIHLPILFLGKIKIG